MDSHLLSKYQDHGVRLHRCIPVGSSWPAFWEVRNDALGGHRRFKVNVSLAEGAHKQALGRRRSDRHFGWHLFRHRHEPSLGCASRQSRTGRRNCPPVGVRLDGELLTICSSAQLTSSRRMSAQRQRYSSTYDRVKPVPDIANPARCHFDRREKSASHWLDEKQISPFDQNVSGHG